VHDLQSIAIILPPTGEKKHPLDYAQKIEVKITTALAHNALLQGIIMPESAYPYCLNTMPEIIELFAAALERSSGEPCTLVLGSYKEEEDKVQNSLYCVTDRRLILAYDKTKHIPFVEYLPFPWKKCSTMRNLFLKGKKESTSTKKIPDPLFLANRWWQPAVCADLFLEATHLQWGHLPLLCIVNDSWFSQEYMRNLMKLFACYTAIQAERELFYVGHYDGLWITAQGDMVMLPCL
jgi:apolipoprotein N-acyltransferase